MGALRNKLIELQKENERLQEIISYLPKVPTQPYEKELAQKVIELEVTNSQQMIEYYRLCDERDDLLVKADKRNALEEVCSDLIEALEEIASAPIELAQYSIKDAQWTAKEALAKFRGD